MKDFSDARVSLKYHLTYLYVSLSLVILLFSTRYLIKLIYNLPSIVSDIAPAIGILFLPLTFLHGGYFYDFFELMFLALCLICIVRRKWVFYYTLFFLAILNKEPNILLILFFMAFCQGVLPKKELMKHLAMQLFIGVITVQLLWHIFAGNPGMTIEHHLTGSIHFWLRPTSYFLFFDPYHLGFPIFPRGGNILSILFVGFLVFYKWGQKPLSLRWLFVYTSIVNISLLLYACHIDELRNLSFMFPSVYLLGVYSIYSLIYKTRLNKVPRHES
jgi:hypothetical protein